MIAISFLAVVLIVSLIAGTVGFLLGYFTGRRAGAKGSQAGFPVLPVSVDSSTPDPDPLQPR